LPFILTLEQVKIYIFSENKNKNSKIKYLTKDIFIINVSTKTHVNIEKQTDKINL